jgi:uncharacterized protein with NRDE domain
MRTNYGYTSRTAKAEWFLNLASASFDSYAGFDVFVADSGSSQWRGHQDTETGKKILRRV